MRLINNAKIRTKLFVGFLLLLVITIIVAAFGAINIVTVDNQYTYTLSYPVTRRSYLRDIEVVMMDLRRTMNRSSMYASEVDPADPTNPILAANVRNVGIDSQSALIQTNRTDMLRYFDNFRTSLLADTEIEASLRDEQLHILDNLQRIAIHYVDHYIASAMQAARAGNAMQTITITRGATATVNEFYSAFDALRDIIETRMATINQELTDVTYQTLWILIGLSIFGVVLGILTALIISNAITKPINSLVRLVKDVARGNLSVNTNRSNISRDEVGMLNTDMYNLIDTIKNLEYEISNMATEQLNGKLDVFINEDKFEGAYSELAERTNSLVKTGLNIQKDIVEVFSSIADGDFDIVFDDMPGDYRYINQSVELMRQNVKNISSSIGEVINAASVKGELNFKLDTDGFSGGWLTIMEGLNKVCESVNDPVLEIREVMSRLIVGDFTKKIEGNYVGDFKKISVAINGTISFLNDAITEMSVVLASIAKGDLTTRINREYLGSFVEIKSSINNIAETLNKTMSEINASTDQVLSGAKQISQSAMELANGAQTQASSVQELNASIDLITQQTRSNADNSETASGLSNKSTASAKEGNDAMKQMLDAMLAIRESSDNISKIIKVIQDIAFQTNLLSLNAAVEAARAGEHGKGFGVVAEEVRNLAARSQKAASETTELIQSSIDRVETGSSIAQTTASSLDAIVSSANEVMGIIDGISTASKEQADAVDQIAMGLQQISTVVQSNSSVSEETAAAAQELNSQADLLRQLVSYFRV